MDPFTMNLEEIQVFTSKSSGFMRLPVKNQIAMSRHPLLCMVVDNGQKLVDGDGLGMDIIAPFLHQPMGEKWLDDLDFFPPFLLK